MLSKEEVFTEMILMELDFSNFEYNIERFFDIFIYNDFLNKIKRIYEKYFPFNFYKTLNLINVYYKNEVIYIKFTISNTKINIKEKEFLTKEEEEKLFKNFILNLTRFIKRIKKTDNKIYFNLKECCNISLSIDIERKIKFEEFINMLKLNEIKESSDFSFNIIGNEFKIWNFKQSKNDFRLIKLNNNIKLKNKIINVKRELKIEVKKSNKFIRISNIKGVLIEENDDKNNYIIIINFYIKDKNDKFIINLIEIYKNKDKDKFINIKINNKEFDVDISFNVDDVNEFIKLLLLNLIKKKRILFKKTKIWKMIDDIKLITIII